MSKEQENCFVNEIVMNEYTLREILLAMWRRKAARRRFPIVIYLIVTVVPMVYAFVTGKNAAGGRDRISGPASSADICRGFCCQRDQKAGSIDSPDHGKIRE